MLYLAASQYLPALFVSEGLIVGCGLCGVVNEMDWKDGPEPPMDRDRTSNPEILRWEPQEPRRVLFAVLDAEAFEADPWTQWLGRFFF